MLNGFIYILVANCINLFISIINGFILPKFLAVETYAFIKMFQLYVQYIGFFHLGYVDGIYLELGGKDIHELDKTKLTSQLIFFILFQSVIVMLNFSIGLFLHDAVLIIFALNIIPLNVATLYKYIYQATGEFKKYSRILNLTSILTVTTNLILLFIFKTQNYMYYLVSNTLVNMIIVYIIHRGIKTIMFNKYDFRFKLSEQMKYIFDGFFLMIGNFSSIVLTSMDRWFVKLFLTIHDFAFYSFAISIESLITTFTTPITITMYNYFCKNNNEEKITFVRNILLLAVSVLISSAFLIKAVIEVFLVKYTNSIKVIFILFAAQFFSILIKGIYINLYKVEKKQKMYFSKMMFIVVLGAFLNVLFGYLNNSIESYALATLLSFIVWFFLCYKDFSNIKYSLKDMSFIIINIISFLLLGLNTSYIFGFLVYLIIVFSTSFLFFKRETLFILKRIYNLIFKFLHF